MLPRGPFGDTSTASPWRKDSDPRWRASLIRFGRPRGVDRPRAFRGEAVVSIPETTASSTGDGVPTLRAHDSGCRSGAGTVRLWESTLALTLAIAAMDEWLRDEAAEAGALLARIAEDDQGAVLPSVYETSRLVRTARWLRGHGARLRFLIDEQHSDGTWGQPDGYALVPTLAATEALLAELGEPAREGPARGELLASATAGLRALRRWLGAGPAVPVPDTIGVETLGSWLLGEINGLLAGLAIDPMAGLDAWAGVTLPLPAGLDDRTLAALREAVRRGNGLPEKYWHGLEAFGAAAYRAPFVHPRNGVVGGSAAATAAWLGPARPRTTRPCGTCTRPSSGTADRWRASRR